MQIDVTVELRQLDGTHLVDEGDKNRVMTVRSICCHALSVNLQGEETTGDEKCKRWQLAQKIYGHDKVDLKAEDVAKIKGLIGKMYAPIVVGQVFLAIDPEPEQSTGE